jgi:hypothetical protein
MWIVSGLITAVVLTFVILVGLGALLPPEHQSPSSVAPPVPAAVPAPTEPYTFPAVAHTPDATAQARLACAEMGNYAQSLVWRRQRTGLPLEEALVLLRTERGGTPMFRPLERVTYMAYSDPEGTPTWTRGFVQRSCLRDMLGSLAEPTHETPASAPAPTPAPVPVRGKRK